MTSVFLLVILSASSRSQQTRPVVSHNLETHTQIQNQPESNIDCMADAIYYEAGHESLLGKEAVGRVIYNRIRHGFSKTACGVVNQRIGTTSCQFVFRCTPHPTPPSHQLYLQCERIAEEILVEGKYVEVVPPSALFFHAVYVHPKWAHYVSVAQIGGHIFYAVEGEG